MSVDTRYVRAQRHSLLAEAIRRESAAIISRWADRALAEQGDRERVHHAELIDHLPQFLEDLSRSLEESRDESSRDRWAREHGQQRWQSGWSLPDLVRDYQILQIVLLEHLEDSLGRPLSSREFMAIGVALDDAIATSVSTFVGETEQRHRLSSEALREQTQRLKELDRRKNEFLAVLGHELRNPLGPIKTALDLMSLAPDAETIAWSRDVLNRQVDQMMRLVDDLLDFSRLSQGKLNLQRDRVDFACVVREAASDLRAVFEQSELTLDCQVNGEPVWIEGDAIRLRQVVTNLLLNARKFTDPRGLVTVRLATDGSAGTDRTATLRIRDTGIGIEPELLPRIFETFTQGRAGLEDGRSGLGLGLALVKQLLDHHSGEVSAASDGPGRGSEFVVRLPVLPV